MMKSADGQPLKMIQKIAAGDYMTFGMLLLQDDNGEEVTVIKRDHIHDGAESVTQAILIKWLTSGAPTRTYQHLIECLSLSELGALADNIADTVAGEGVQNYILHISWHCTNLSWCVKTLMPSKHKTNDVFPLFEISFTINFHTSDITQVGKLPCQ